MASQLETFTRSSLWPAVVALFVCLLVPSAARADTVYLKNGRTITASEVQVLEDEGKVILLQGATRVVIPLALVERIVEDEAESEILEPGTAEPTPVAEEPAEEAEGEEVAEGEAPPGEVVEGEEAVLSEDTREYWQAAVRAIEDEKAQLEEALQELRREERAFLFSHRSTADTKAQIEAVQQRLEELDQAMAALRREARRKGIPPGWLRLDPRPEDRG